MSNNEIDDFLLTLGVPPGSRTTASPSPTHNQPELASVSLMPSESSVSSASPEGSTSVPSSSVPSDTSEGLTDADFSDILAENGFIETPEMPSEENDFDADNWDDFDDDDEEEEFNPSDVEDTDYEVRADPPIAVSPSNQQRVADTPNTNQPSSEEQSTATDDSSLLPLNSPTLLMDESTARFSGAEWYNEIQKARIILAGIGGIGSNVAFQLARMVPASITLYDDDNVEAVNMAGQLYSYEYIGMSKVDAMESMISSYTSMRQIYAVKEKFTNTCEPGDIMICGFDNMTARKIFFCSWLKHMFDMPEKKRRKCLYLDGRLSMDTLQIFCIRGDDVFNIGRYRNEFLFADSEADETVCSMKQTTYLACMIGSLMVNLFTNFIANTLNPIIPYDLPFFTEYDAQNVLFKTEN